MKRDQKLFAVMVFGAVVGAGASFWQTLEKLVLLENQDAVLSCNLGSVFSCSNVLNASQSSLFGFPNSIMSLMLFVLFLGVGLVGLSGGVVTQRLRLAIQGLSLFTLGFGLWFLFQSTYRIGSICIFCMVNFAGLLMVNAAWLRINQAELSRKFVWLPKFVKQGGDMFVWLLCAILIAAAVIFKFYV